MRQTVDTYTQPDRLSSVFTLANFRLAERMDSSVGRLNFLKRLRRISIWSVHPVNVATTTLRALRD